MGATLANNGRNPATGEQVIKAENVPHILSTMIMAGLYDGSYCIYPYSTKSLIHL